MGKSNKNNNSQKKHNEELPVINLDDTVQINNLMNREYASDDSGEYGEPVGEYDESSAEYDDLSEAYSESSEEYSELSEEYDDSIEEFEDYAEDDYGEGYSEGDDGQYGDDEAYEADAGSFIDDDEECEVGDDYIYEEGDEEYEEDPEDMYYTLTDLSIPDEYLRKKTSKKRVEEEEPENANSRTKMILAVALFAVAVILLAAVLLFAGKNSKTNEGTDTLKNAADSLYSLTPDAAEGMQRLTEYAMNATPSDSAASENTAEENGEKKCTMKLGSVDKDLKVKFLDDETQKLITGVLFEVTVTESNGDSFVIKDEDLDGIVYKNGLKGGKVTVSASAPDVTFTNNDEIFEVLGHIEYKKIEIKEEIKTEAEVNAAEEDTEVKPAAEEEAGKPKDTVEWVESTKTPIGEGESEEFVPLDIENIIKPTAGAEKTEVDNPVLNGYNVTGTQEIHRVYRIGSRAALLMDEEDESKEVVAFVLSETERTLKEGESFSLTAIATKADGSTKSSDSSDKFKFESSDEKVASVDKNGNITGVSAGQVTITVKYKDASASCTVSVKDAGKSKDKDDDNKDDSGEKKDDNNNDSVEGDKDKNADSGDGLGEKDKKDDSKDTSESDNSADKNEGAKDADSAEAFKDDTTPLKSTDGKQVYIKKKDGTFREATYADYYAKKKFYLKADVQYKYTGWQTIDGNTYFFDKDGNKVTGEQIIQGVKYSFNSDGILATDKNAIMGIDVSSWNGSIDWNAVRDSGIKFVIIRCGYRGSKSGALVEDSKFRGNIQGAQAAGLKVGVYFFTQAVNEVEGVEEASMVSELLKGYGLGYPVFIDTESAGGGRADSLDKATRTSAVGAFCKTLENSGYHAGIYASKFWYLDNLDYGSLSSYKIWMAQYASEPSFNKHFDLWQYSKTGKVSGIKGNVDLDISYLGY